MINRLGMGMVGLLALAGCAAGTEGTLGTVVDRTDELGIDPSLAGDLGGSLPDDVIPYGGNTAYQFLDDYPFDYADNSGTGTALALEDDGVGAITLPFEFKFYGVPYTDVTVAANGVIAFAGADPDKFSATNMSLPTATDATSFIAVYWDDMLPLGTTNITWQVEGEEPSRSVTIQWHNIVHFLDPGETPRAQFEVTLFERTQLIVLQYSNLEFGGNGLDNGGSATIGAQANDLFGQTYSFNAENLAPGTAILLQVDGCGADDMCEAACDYDPDCPECFMDGVCNLECVLEVDPDCPVCGADGMCNEECDTDPDCTPPPPATCIADELCDPNCEPMGVADPDCQNCEKNDVCNPVCEVDPDCDGGCATTAGSSPVPPLGLLLLGFLSLAVIRRRR